MQRKTQVLLTFGVLIIMVSSLYFFTDWFSKVTGYFKGEDELSRLTLCLKNKNAEFYGSTSPETEMTIKEFGQDFKSIRYVDCGREKEKCPNIQEIPAWFIDNQIYYGYKNITELKQISGCEV